MPIYCSGGISMRHLKNRSAKCAIYFFWNKYLRIRTWVYELHKFILIALPPTVGYELRRFGIISIVLLKVPSLGRRQNEPRLGLHLAYRIAGTTYLMLLLSVKMKELVIGTSFCS